MAGEPSSNCYFAGVLMVSLLGNRKTRNLLLQAIFLLGIAATIAFAVMIARRNMATQNVTVGWDFLDYAAGWAISFSILPYELGDTYWRALAVGFVNTLVLGVISITFAMILGTSIGTARLVQNKLLRGLAATFVQIFRNLPLILQAFFWYTIITHLPSPRSAIVLPGSIYISNRGLFLPWLNAGTLQVLLILLSVVLGAVMSVVFLKRRQSLLAAGTVAVAATTAGLLLYLGHVPGDPFLDLPVVKGLRINGGISIVPEFGAAIISITLFGAAYIAEVVRAGFLAIPKGLIEAGSALGLSSSHVFWRIRLPMMIRLVMPTMTNQVVWLMKATTIGIAIGFTDFFAIIAQSINHSGQTITLVFILILGFWSINMTIAFVMNRINRAIALPGYKK